MTQATQDSAFLLKYHWAQLSIKMENFVLQEPRMWGFLKLRSPGFVQKPKVALLGCPIDVPLWGLFSDFRIQGSGMRFTSRGLEVGALANSRLGVSTLNPLEP